MAQATATDSPELTPEQTMTTMTMITRMLIIGAIFVVVGYLRIGAACTSD